MSYWTYVNGTIEVNIFGNTQPQSKYILETVLEHLPYVTGSETNMNTYVVQKQGHSSSSSHNEFGEPMWHRPFKTHFKTYEQQDHYLVVISGSLRDRMYEETLKELNKWLNRLSKRILVEDILVKIAGQGRELVIKNCEPYGNMYESYANYKKNENGQENMPWTDYLMWDRAPGSDLPLYLYSKYFQDLEVDEEIKRRKTWINSMEKKINVQD